MNSHRLLTILVIIGALLLVLPSTPVQLSYVYSDSMEPTISVGDGYVIVPADAASPGDIVTFRSDTREEYITHRVVEVVDGGYLTKGDNNPSTDQAAGHPVVTDEDLVGRVLTVGDTPVVIPYLADVASAITTYWPVWLLVVLLGGGLLERKPRARDVARLRDLMVPLIVTSVVGTAIVMAYAAPTYSMSLVAVVSGTADGRFVPLGETAMRSIDVADPPRFTYQFVEGSGVTIADTVVTEGTKTVTVAIPPRSGPGEFTATMTAYHYPTVLPYGLMSALHGLHPMAAALASMTTLLAPLVVAHWLAFDGKTPLEWRSRSRGWLK